MKYCIYNQVTGEILKWTTHEETHEGFVCAEIPFSIEDGYISEGRFVPFPQKPSPTLIWDWTEMAWSDPRTLADLKADKWGQIKAARAAEEFGGFTLNGQVFDSDAISQSRIQGAVLLATLATSAGLPYSITWTLADNTTVDLDAQGMMAVGIALGQHVSGSHSKARELRAQIEAAESKEALDSIEWA
jgi:hypothetical protein